jgi:hypothetical protein
MDSTGPPAAPMALYTNIAYPAAKPPSSTPSRPPPAPMAIGPSITTKTTITVMAVATTTRIAPVAVAVVALLARPPPPLVPTAGPTHRGRPTATAAGAHDYVPPTHLRWTVASASLRGHTGPLRVSQPPVRATAAAPAVPASRSGPGWNP